MTGCARAFVVKASQAYVSCTMEPRALAPYGRLDVVARAAIAALSTRRGLRRDTRFYAVLEGCRPGPLTLELDGGSMDRVLLSEGDFGELVRDLACGVAIRGAALYEGGFRELVNRLVREWGRERVFYMHERGVDVSEVEIRPPAAFILGDHMGLEPAAEGWLRSLGTAWVSVGATAYFTEHVITFIHALLDGHVAVR